MSRLGRAAGSLAALAAGAGLIIMVWTNTWSERAAAACAFGAFALLTALPNVRKDGESDRAFIGAVLGLAGLVASAMIAVYVVHSWAWLGVALALFLVVVGFEIWEWYDERRTKGPGIDEDIEEKQHRQDEQLQKTFFHP